MKSKQNRDLIVFMNFLHLNTRSLRLARIQTLFKRSLSNVSTQKKLTKSKLKVATFIEEGRILKHTPKELEEKQRRLQLKIDRAKETPYSEQKALLIAEQILGKKLPGIGPLIKLSADNLLKLFDSLDLRLMYAVLGVSANQLKDSYIVREDTLQFLRRDDIQRAVLLCRLAKTNGVVGMNEVLKYLVSTNQTEAALKLLNVRKKWGVPCDSITYTVLYSTLHEHNKNLPSDIISQVQNIFEKQIKSHLKPNNSHSNSFVSVLLKSGLGNTLKYLKGTRGLKTDVKTFTMLLNAVNDIPNHYLAAMYIDEIWGLVCRESIRNPNFIDPILARTYCLRYLERDSIIMKARGLKNIFLFYEFGISTEDIDIEKVIEPNFKDFDKCDKSGLILQLKESEFMIKSNSKERSEEHLKPRSDDMIIREANNQIFDQKAETINPTGKKFKLDQLLVNEYFKSLKYLSRSSLYYHSYLALVKKNRNLVTGGMLITVLKSLKKIPEIKQNVGIEAARLLSEFNDLQDKQNPKPLDYSTCINLVCQALGEQVKYHINDEVPNLKATYEHSIQFFEKTEKRSMLSLFNFLMIFKTDLPDQYAGRVLSVMLQSFEQKLFSFSIPVKETNEGLNFFYNTLKKKRNDEKSNVAHATIRYERAKVMMAIKSLKSFYFCLTKINEYSKTFSKEVQQDPRDQVKLKLALEKFKQELHLYMEIINKDMITPLIQKAEGLSTNLDVLIEQEKKLRDFATEAGMLVRIYNKNKA